MDFRWMGSSLPVCGRTTCGWSEARASARARSPARGRHSAADGEADRPGRQLRRPAGDRWASTSVEQPVRAGRHVARREHLEGDQSPWKDRGPRHQRWCGGTTDSSTEQSLEGASSTVALRRGGGGTRSERSSWKRGGTEGKVAVRHVGPREWEGGRFERRAAAHGASHRQVRRFRPPEACAVVAAERPSDPRGSMRVGPRDERGTAPWMRSPHVTRGRISRETGEVAASSPAHATTGQVVLARAEGTPTPRLMERGATATARSGGPRSGRPPRSALLRRRRVGGEGLGSLEASLLGGEHPAWTVPGRPRRPRRGSRIGFGRFACRGFETAVHSRPRGGPPLRRVDTGVGNDGSAATAVGWVGPPRWDRKSDPRIRRTPGVARPSATQAGERPGDRSAAGSDRIVVRAGSGGCFGGRRWRSSDRHRTRQRRLGPRAGHLGATGPSGPARLRPVTRAACGVAGDRSGGHQVGHFGARPNDGPLPRWSVAGGTSPEV